MWQIIGICCTSLHNTHELSVHLCFVIFSSFPVWVWIFFDKNAYFHANWLYIIHIRIKRVKSTIFGNFSVFSVLCHNCLYLSKNSYENFYSPWPSLTFKTIIIFHVKSFFTSAQGPTVKYLKLLYNELFNIMFWLACLYSRVGFISDFNRLIRLFWWCDQGKVTPNPIVY